MASARLFIADLLSKADIQIGGNRPQDITVHDERIFNRIIRYGTIGLGEGYMDGWWEANNLDVTIAYLLRARVDKAIEINLGSLWTILKAFLFNQQSISKA